MIKVFISSVISLFLFYNSDIEFQQVVLFIGECFLLFLSKLLASNEDRGIPELPTLPSLYLLLI